MADTHQTPAHSAALMVGSRVVNMAIGLLTIPVLIRYLGGSGFASWAILLAVSAGFSLLEFGMPSTVVRFLALPARDGDWHAGRRLFGRVWLLLALTYGVASVLVLWVARPLAAWFDLPDTPILSAAGTLLWVFAAVGLRAFLQGGVLSLYAARRFKAVSAVAMLQPLCSNVAAMVTAWQTGRLDLTLMAFWITQLGVLGTTFFLARSACLPRFDRDTFKLGRLKELGYYGLTSQMEGWAQFVNFQFDKFIIAGLVGLWAVAPYEVANRSVTALRSVPASGLESLLPSAVTRHEDRDEAWRWYLSSTRIAVYGVCAFMFAPLAVAPLFLYAWTGEMGYLGRWVFVALIVGAMANVLAMPAATLAQAAGKPGLQGRAAVLGVLINIPLSLTLVFKWGSAGAALGTSAAMLVSAAYLLFVVHRHLDRALGPTLKLLAKFWPVLLVGLAWFAVTYLFFSGWFASLDPALRYSRATRAYPGLVALGVYLLCVGSMLAVLVLGGALSARERAWLRGLLVRR